MHVQRKFERLQQGQQMKSALKSTILRVGLLLCFNGMLWAQSAAPQQPSCFSIHVSLNGKLVDGPQVITLKTKQDENTVSLEQGCFKVPPAMLNEKKIAVSFTLPGNDIDIGSVATGFFTGVWDVELEDKKFSKDTPLPKHTRARKACAIVFHMGDEPERGLSVVPCRSPLPSTTKKPLAQSTDTIGLGTRQSASDNPAGGGPKAEPTARREPSIGI
jgi:hypothetical protein